jgi:7,8-didemethyl-8-hydroxy-5-deazariboflavin synthase CofH subunit/7,8-didemethyl-8-hydroxy-5-deazariboflavin synthase CofG subunit
MARRRAGVGVTRRAAAAAAAASEQHWSLAPYDAQESQLVDRLLTGPLDDLMAEARAVRDSSWPGDTAALSAAATTTPAPAPGPLLPRPITFSPKVFIPLTRACRDSCAYCTFAQSPSSGRRIYMTLDEVSAVAQAGAKNGCTEALLTLGDRPEARWPEAAAELQSMGFASTLEYVEAACARVLAETGLLPHVNAGLADEAWLARLKRASASGGLMLEGVDPSLNLPGAAHDALTCPDKLPGVRLEAIEAAGKAKVPFTTGVLVGIGESRRERLRALLALRRLHSRYGHVQEVIVQNFVPKGGTGAEEWPACSLEELLWSVACARVVLPADVSVQAPPNLTPERAGQGFESDAAPPSAREEAALEASWRALLNAGINDWGGVSPLTRDWVNPEKPWPHVAALARATADATGRPLLPRLPVYPRYFLLGGQEGEGWLSEVGGAFSVAAAVRRHSDGSGLSRGLGGWFAGVPDAEDDDEAARPSAAAAAGLAASGGRGVARAVSDSGGGSGGGRRSSNPQQTKRPASGATLARTNGWAVALDAYGGTIAGLPAPSQVTPALRQLLERLLDPERDEVESIHSSSSSSISFPTPREVEALLSARGADAAAVRAAADALRFRVCGDTVSYVVNRNLNYTNVCTYGCTFCGFSKAKPGEEDAEGSGEGAAAAAQRDPPYVVPAAEVSRRAKEAWDRGATEICMQGGIHPNSTGETYLQLLRAAKEGAPKIHAHAFSPLEVVHGAKTLGLSVEAFLRELRAAGLGSLPGTAAEILHDQVRREICADKLSADEWCGVMESAAAVARAEEQGAANDGSRRPPPLRATATMMFGHVDTVAHQARHLLALKGLQARTRGFFTEFVPLPFVAENAPAFLRGQARRGPTLREAVLAHSTARLVLHPHFVNIQASWVKMGPRRASAVLLNAGCNDMGGTLMNESITRASGAAHGQELSPREMERLIKKAGRRARQRTTTYFGEVEGGQVGRSLSEEGCKALAPVVKVAAVGGAAGLAGVG